MPVVLPPPGRGADQAGDADDAALRRGLRPHPRVPGAEGRARGRRVCPGPAPGLPRGAAVPRVRRPGPGGGAGGAEGGDGGGEGGDGPRGAVHRELLAGVGGVRRAGESVDLFVLVGIEGLQN